MPFIKDGFKGQLEEGEEKGNISLYKNIFKGKNRPMAILGSGPTLAESLKKLPEDVLFMSINSRPLQLVPHAHFSFSTDREEAVRCYQKEDDCINLSFDYKYSDLIISMTDVPGLVFSGITGTALALYLGANPIILCGMDLYSSTQAYFDTCHGYLHNAQGHPKQHKVDQWKVLVNKFPIAKEHVFLLGGGPLKDTFKEYKNE